MEGSIAQLRQAIDVLCALDPKLLGTCESIVEPHRELARLDATTTRATAAFDASRDWEPSGARSAATWLAVDCKLSPSRARRRVRLGRALRHMPETERQWLAGEITDEHVGLLATAQERAPECFAEAECELVGWAAQLRFGSFSRLLAYWAQRADPGGDERNAKRQHDNRRLSVSQSFEGMWFLDGVLDPIGGEIFSKALKRIEDELFAADWAEARARVGDGVCVADLGRTAGQRRADALVEMARRAMAVPAGARLPEPLLCIFMDYTTATERLCELASGTVVSPAAVLPWLTRAHVERVVFAGPDRVINVGERRRFFEGATRRAVELRDRECYHPYCTDRDDCQVDHVIPYSEGGLTTTDNGRVACGAHNRSRNEKRGPP